MSGHSKWHNIRLRKGKQDVVRGKLFTRIAKEIIIAAQSGGGSADTNVRLRMAIQTARQNSMPSENIKRAVQRGTGELGGANLVEMVFEDRGIKWILGAGINKIENGIAHYENLEGEYKTEMFDFAMLIPAFSGHGFKAFDKNNTDITESLELR